MVWWLLLASYGLVLVSWLAVWLRSVGLVVMIGLDSVFGNGIGFEVVVPRK